MRHLETATVAGQHVHYRPGTSDWEVLQEVLVSRCYRNELVGFDVEEGERWLDLGGNIGAFALYCRSRGAECISYEPDPECFDIFKLNAPEAEVVRACVTADERKYLQMFKPQADHKLSRNSIIEFGGSVSTGQVPNVHIEDALEGHFDGIKMDIEGSEFGIIDEGLIPLTRKLVFEYHTSRDPSPENLHRRLEILSGHFAHVAIPPILQRYADGSGESFYDQTVWCWNDPR